MKCDFGLAIVKGLIEHGDGTSYFGSLMGYQQHVSDAVARGLVAGGIRDLRVTEHGRAQYDGLRLHLLPQVRFSRAYAWDWSGVGSDVDAENARKRPAR